MRRQPRLFVDCKTGIVTKRSSGRRKLAFGVYLRGSHEAEDFYENYDGNNLRANKGNPNHPSYWRERGFDDRPEEWKVDCTEKRKRGLLEYQINQAASRRPEQRRAAGRDTTKVIDASRKALGSRTTVVLTGLRDPGRTAPVLQ